MVWGPGSYLLMKAPPKRSKFQRVERRHRRYGEAVTPFYPRDVSDGVPRSLAADEGAFRSQPLFEETAGAGAQGGEGGAGDRDAGAADFAVATGD